MKTVGLIVEYNPLHYGHVHHYTASKITTKADCVIAVMSGHFLQRGEPAIVGKWARAEAALRMGADVVLELPVRYSTSPAEWFAYGAVSLLNATGVVDSLCFGSELGELKPLQSLADLLQHEPESFKQYLKLELKKGNSYPSAYSKAIQHITQAEIDPAAKPNNNLGLHYLLALARTHSSIEPFTVPRIKAEFHQSDITDQTIASATAIRGLIHNHSKLSALQAYMPEYMLHIIEQEFKAGRGPVSWESFTSPMLYQLQSHTAKTLADFDEVDEGLEHRILRAMVQLKTEVFTIPKLMDALKTKRYTKTKLQRMLLRILLQQSKVSFTRDLLAEGPAYIRVLGFSEAGQALLKQMKKKASLPVITTVERKHSALLEEELRATAIYAMAYQDATLWHMQRDYYQSPIRL